ncbi:MAG: glucokinase [Dongiaceae bacterium]
MSDNARSLVGDIGGSTARFAIARAGPGGVVLDHVLTMPAADYPALATAVEHYLAATGVTAPTSAAIAIAGPIVGDRAEITNHSAWSFSIDAVRRCLGLVRLAVINDFTAVALSLPQLPPAELRQVGGEAPADGASKAVIGPGTGLGVSGIARTDDRWTAIEGEGGHATFAPMSARESRIGEVLRQRFGHVSWERILSGPGLVNLYDAVAELEGTPAEVLSPETIAAHGRAGDCRLCREALEIFCAALGTAAGNLALTFGARGGVYVAGGIVPQLGDFFAASAFRSRFESKGRLSTYVRPIPTYVVTAATPGLVGAAVAALDAGQRP